MTSLEISLIIAVTSLTLSLITIFVKGNIKFYSQKQRNPFNKFIKYFPLGSILLVVSILIAYYVKYTKQEKENIYKFQSLKDSIIYYSKHLDTISDISFYDKKKKDSILNFSLGAIQNNGKKLKTLIDRFNKQEFIIGKGGNYTDSLKQLLYESSQQAEKLKAMNDGSLNKKNSILPIFKPNNTDSQGFDSLSNVNRIDIIKEIQALVLSKNKSLINARLMFKLRPQENYVVIKHGLHFNNVTFIGQLKDSLKKKIAVYDYDYSGPDRFLMDTTADIRYLVYNDDITRIVVALYNIK